MASSRRFLQSPPFCFLTFVSVVSFFLLFRPAFRATELDERRRRDSQNSTEDLAELVDPAAIDLTPLVNALINSSRSGARQLFSLLSVTSFSSLALHKLTLLVYNISSIKGLESSVFRRRFCYCVTNDTNDLADFTAVLLDVMGNSSSSLHEIFKSSSILSVSQRNNSDCIYICVMAGKMGRELPELWDGGSVTPLFNQTVIEGPRSANISSIRLPADWHQLPTNLSPVPRVSPSGLSSALSSRVLSTAHASSNQSRTTAKVTMSLHPSTASSRTTLRSPPSRTTPPEAERAGTSSLTLSRTAESSEVASEPQKASSAFSPLTHRTEPAPSRTTRPTTRPAPSRTSTSSEDGAGCPWRRPEVDGDAVPGAAMTVGAQKLQPCVLELCRFFSQCLCRPSDLRSRLKRFCVDSHRWYESHTSEVCRRVKRVSLSRNLKQRCLSKICEKPRAALPHRK